ncbi:MAG: DUF29 domain-containing protein [Candidatus Competibacter sp.]|nr:DUF29 domain-containing protein [Candidatus Competibacter sp.]MDG4584945.1 DUF29 domain-containing protein [Candidatus Competibacter sp.]
MTITAYETDFYQWTQQQAALMRQGEFNRVDLDIENIAEEIESMGRRDRYALRSYLHNILMHLLKWWYQPERRGTSWRLSIKNGRHQIDILVEDSPSLQGKIPDLVAKEYTQARENAALETGLSLATFPELCPFTVEQITGDYWPD